MLRDSYHPHLTDFEKLIKIAGIPEFNINEHFNVLKKVYQPWRYYIKNVGNRQIPSKENVNWKLSKNKEYKKDSLFMGHLSRILCVAHLPLFTFMKFLLQIRSLIYTTTKLLKIA